MNTDTRCPCGTGETYGNCCGKIHAAFHSSGKLAASTPEALMRSRFTAFAISDADYLLASWHTSTRPSVLDLDETLRWYRLDILGTTGSPFVSTGTVEFAAYYRSLPSVADEEKIKGVQRENSRFVRENGEWFYVDGDVS